jgi:hypothetical protein
MINLPQVVLNALEKRRDILEESQRIMKLSDAYQNKANDLCDMMWQAEAAKKNLSCLYYSKMDQEVAYNGVLGDLASSKAEQLYIEGNKLVLEAVESSMPAETTVKFYKGNIFINNEEI